MTKASVVGHPIVCLGFAEWDAEIMTNQHHLMSRLSEVSPILFIESLGLRRPTASVRDARRIVSRLKRGIRPLRHVGNIAVLSPIVLPYHGTSLTRRLNRWLLRRAVRRAVKALGFGHPLILWTYVPQGKDLVSALRPDLVVYHCVDDIAAHERIDSVAFHAAEVELVENADLVLASSQPLQTRLGQLSDRVRLMANVADTDAFARALDTDAARDSAMERLPHPRVVFAGAISEVKVDFGLIRQLARANRDWAIALVGPVGLGDPTTDPTSLTTEPNIHLLGHRSHEDLPRVMASADAAIIPYRITRLTSSIFPMKVYEYLAAGLPTVSTPLPALAGLDDIEIATDAEEMGAVLERLMAEDDEGQRERRSQRVRGHSWAERIREIEGAVGELEWRR